MSHRSPNPYEFEASAHPRDRRRNHHAERYDDPIPAGPHPYAEHAHRPDYGAALASAEGRHDPRSRPRPSSGRPRAKPRPSAAAADYTFGHAGRQIRFGPVAFWTIVGTLVIMAAWSLVTATYFAFHDDVIKRLLARQAEMQYAYEDRIAEMRTRVDRVTSRQLLDQEQFEQKLDQLLRRQSMLESRASALTSLTDPNVTGSVRVPARSGPVRKAAPISGPDLFPPATDRRAEIDRRGGPERVLARLQDSLDRVEVQQTTTLNSLEETYGQKARRIRTMLTDLGLNVDKAASHRGVGGPFIPVRLPANANAFDRQIYRTSLARAQVDRLSRALDSVPVRSPVEGEIDTSSGFGVRIDPFLGRPAMHTGVDIRASIGDPVRATAAGTVTQAGWNGGYGKMVEIDHGNGLATRYGHLSAVEATVGQKVKIGQVIGRVGSTGRSTGPHLHYETRVAGDPVDPQKFLRAAAQLGHGS